MTAPQLQTLAMLLSRSLWVRHWLHWNYPCRDPWLMAISVHDADGCHPFERSGIADELTKAGFVMEDQGKGDAVFVIRRTNENGTPYQ